MYPSAERTAPAVTQNSRWPQLAPAFGVPTAESLRTPPVAASTGVRVAGTGAVRRGNTGGGVDSEASNNNDTSRRNGGGLSKRGRDADDMDLVSLSNYSEFNIKSLYSLQTN